MKDHDLNVNCIFRKKLSVYRSIYLTFNSSPRKPFTKVFLPLFKAFVGFMPLIAPSQMFTANETRLSLGIAFAYPLPLTPNLPSFKTIKSHSLRLLHSTMLLPLLLLLARSGVKRHYGNCGSTKFSAYWVIGFGSS